MSDQVEPRYPIVSYRISIFTPKHYCRYRYPICENGVGGIAYREIVDHLQFKKQTKGWGFKEKYRVWTTWKGGAIRLVGSHF